MNSTLCRRPGVFCCVRTTLTEGGIEGEKGMGVPPRSTDHWKCLYGTGQYWWSPNHGLQILVMESFHVLSSSLGSHFFLCQGKA